MQNNKVPFTNILHIGCHTGEYLAQVKQIMPSVETVGIDVLDYLPSERTIGISQQNFLDLITFAFKFIQGNVLEKQFAKSVEEKFDLVVQECYMNTQEEAFTGFQNFFAKSKHVYVIQGIPSDNFLNFLTNNIQEYVCNNQIIETKILKGSMMYKNKFNKKTPIHSFLIKKINNEQSPNS